MASPAFIAVLLSPLLVPSFHSLIPFRNLSCFSFPGCYVSVTSQSSYSFKYTRIWGLADKKCNMLPFLRLALVMAES